MFWSKKLTLPSSDLWAVSGLCRCLTPALPRSISCSSSLLLSPRLWLHCSPPSRWHWLGTIRCSNTSLLEFNLSHNSSQLSNLTPTLNLFRKRHVREPEQTVVTCRPSCWRCRDSGLHSSGGGESLFR